MLKRLLLMVSVMAVAMGSAMVPAVALAGLAETAPNMVSGGPHPGGGNPHLMGGSQMMSDQPYVEIWTDRGTGSVYSPGERVDVYMRPAYDCFVIVYDIDTDGNLRLIFPYDSRDDGFVRGGEIYRLGMSGFGGYYVTGPSGVEYVHVLASFEPFRPVYWHGQAGYAAYAHDASWRGFSDYWGAAVPPRVYGDPYVAMQSINEFICYDALEAGIAFADFTYFYVEHRVSYPRYLCYDCHGYRPAFHPYVDVCGGFHISFVACDPCYRPCSWWWWCSPRRVYCGPTYVCYAKKPCKKYPEHYKWRTRCDSYGGRGGGTAYGDYYKERVRPGGGRTAEVVRVRPERDKRPDGNTGERYLYPRKESREAIRNRDAIRVGDDARDRKETGGRKETGNRKGAGNREPRVVSPDGARTDRAQYGRAEVRTTPARIERPRVESRKAKKENGWSKLVKVVKTTIERESGRKTRSQARAKDSKTSKASDGKSRKKESDPRIARAQVSSEQKSKQVSDKKSSGKPGKSRKAASRARTDSKGKSQSTRRRVSD